MNTFKSGLRMTLDGAFHRKSIFPRNVMLRVIAVLSFLASGATIVNADLIAAVELNSAQQLISSHDYTFTTLEFVYDPVSKPSDGGCAGECKGLTSDRSLPADPLEPPLAEIPFVGLVAPSSSGGAGTGTPPSHGGGSSCGYAVFATVGFCLSLMLTDRVYCAVEIDIPAPPASELLRPPNSFRSFIAV